MHWDTTDNLKRSTAQLSTIDLVDVHTFTKGWESEVDSKQASTLEREEQLRSQLRHTRTELGVFEAEISYRLHGELVPSGD